MLARSRTQLPVTAYFDEGLFRKEQETIFKAGPRYLGHELAVPQVGDYYALPQEGEGRVLTRSPHGFPPQARNLQWRGPTKQV